MLNVVLIDIVPYRRNMVYVYIILSIWLFNKLLCKIYPIHNHRRCCLYDTLVNEILLNEFTVIIE